MKLTSLRFFSKESISKNLTLYFAMMIIIVLSVVSNANADSSSKVPPAAEALSKVTQSESTVDYAGKRIVIRWHPPRIIAFEERVIHQAPATHLMKRLTPMDRIGAERRPDRDDRSGGKGQSRWERSKRGEGYRMRRMPPPPGRMRGMPPTHGERNPQDTWNADTQLLLRNYTVDIAKGEPIAGQNTYLLTITPKVTLRPKKRVWFDAQRYIILRMEDYDIAGILNSLFVYTTIDYDRTAVAGQLEQYKKERNAEREQEQDFNEEAISFAEAEKQLGTKLSQPSYLPTGFQLQSISMMTFSGQTTFPGKPPVHFKYTDGLTALSLFVRMSEEEEEPPLRGRGDRFGDRPGSRRGREDRTRGGMPITVTVEDIPVSVVDRGHIRVLLWKTSKQGGQKKLHFFLIGELAQEEMVKVAEALISQG